MIKRRRTRTVNLGAVKIGGEHPISIQSMTKTDTADVAATIRQIKELEQAGCEIVRVAVKDGRAALALDKIKARIDIPLVADIHFNYRLALEALSRGVDGIRLNPGNIYRREEVKEVVKACRKRKIPIRVGVNSGSLRAYRHCEPLTSKMSRGEAISKERLLRRPDFIGTPHNDRCKESEHLADLMVKSALDYIKMLENFDFHDIIVSLKASDVLTTVDAYRKLAQRCAYPLHLGVTASGLSGEGLVKSAIGIGSLLLAGIGDTVRVSLTASPVEEVKVAQQILQALSLRNFGPEIIACPTCGRCQINLVKMVKEFQDRLNSLHIKHQTLNNRPLKIALMGCEVNGPGEAREADIGVACGKNCALLFRKGKIIKKIKAQQIADALIKELSEDITYGANASERT